MIKVGYLSLLPDPGLPAVSGVAKVSETLLRCFEERNDLQVEAVTMINDLPQEQIIQQGSVRYHYLPCSSSGKTVALFRREIKVLLQRLADLKVDVVHGQPTILYLLAAHAASLPKVITIHGLMSRGMGNLFKPKTYFLTNFLRDYIQNLVWEVMQRRIAKSAPNIISISPYVDDYLKGFSRGRIWPISNPIDAEFFAIRPVEKSGLRIICVGTVSARKNQVQLVQACLKLASLQIPFECRLVGEPVAATEAQLKSLINGSAAQNRISLAGRVTQPELLQHYEWANCVILPSLEETSPLSLIQGMAAGRMIFGASAGGIPALLRNGQFGTLFRPHAPDDLARNLADFSSRSDPYWKIAEIAQEHARASFQPVSVAQKTVEVYNQVLRQPI